jgi:tetrahydromethanopterin S-methyltransferase subunit G
MKTKHEEKVNPSRGKLPADTKDILKRLDAIEQAVETLDERLSKLEGRFIPYPGHVAARGKNRS